MTNRITLLLFIGLAWGQLKVKSKIDLEPFTVSGISQSTTIVFKNSNIIKESKGVDIQFSVYYECVDKNCTLTIKYLTDESKEITSSLVDEIEDETIRQWLKNRPKEKELSFININEIVKALSELLEYTFGDNETEVEYDFSNGSIKRSIDNNYTLVKNYESLSIGDGIQFLDGIKKWEKQNPQKPKRVFIPYDNFPVLKGRLRHPKIKSSYDGKTGVVNLQVKILMNGKVDSVNITQGVSPYIDSLAIQTVNKSKWRPAKAQGKPADAWISVPINFQY